MEGWFWSHPSDCVFTVRSLMNLQFDVRFMVPPQAYGQKNNSQVGLCDWYKQKHIFSTLQNITNLVLSGLFSYWSFLVLGCFCKSGSFPLSFTHAFHVLCNQYANCLDVSLKKLLHWLRPQKQKILSRLGWDWERWPIIFLFQGLILKFSWWLC